MFLGVDESNHGRVPEILAVCYSNNPEDIVEGNYEKRRSKNLDKRNLGFFDFRHIIFSREDLLLLNKKQPMIIAVCEFAKYFLERGSNLEKIFIDGNLSLSQLDYLYRILENLDISTEISFGPKYDQKIKLVNAADNWANALHRYYATNSGLKKKKYLSHLITPKIEDYLKIS